MSQRRLERGKEPWFAVEARLPNSGLDPSRDCNHVTNEELHFMFGNREKHRGYVYTAAKSERLKERVQELYPAIWQCQSIPEGNFIPESFARALISEVCHLHPMNWAAYAADRWRGKKVEEAHGPVITYSCKCPFKPFLDVVVERLDREIEAARIEYEQFSVAHNEEFRCKVENRSSVQNALSEADKDKYQFEIHCLYELLDKSKQLLEKIQGMKHLYFRSGDEVLIAKFKAEVKRESDEVIGYSSRIRILEDQLNVTERALTVAMDEELRLNRLKSQHLSKFQELMAVKQKLLDRSNFPLFRAPGAAIEVLDFDPDHKSYVQNISISTCALCKIGFPNLDIVIAPCLCTYHPWCVVMQNWIQDTCANSNCKKEFPTVWKRSFGLLHIPGTLLLNLAKFNFKF